MRKLIALMITLVLTFGIVSAVAEEAPGNFPVSDWKILYTFEDSAIKEQLIFIYEDNTFDVIDEDETANGTWMFDGETLVLTANNEPVFLQWNEETHQFTGEYNGLTLTMYLPVEAEDDNSPAEETAQVPPAGGLAGGWTVAEDPAVTEDINNLFFQALNDYQTGTVTVAYTPVALLGTQVVAGTNYAVLSRASEINQGSKWVIIYLYQDLEGNTTVLNISDVELGI